MSSSDKSPALVQGAAPTPSAIKPDSHSPPVQQSLALPLSEPLPVPLPVGAPTALVKAPSPPMPLRAKLKMRLWLCIHLPALPLEALARHERALARAVFEDEQGIRRVLLANRQASAAGIRAGLSVNAALSLLPDLSLEMRCPDREERALKCMGAWAERFTSFVSLEPPRTLLLEIAGSLRLFEGLATLRRRIAQSCAEQGFTANLAIAPTPQASLWLAKTGREVCIDNMAHLNGHLSVLPLHCLDWPASVTELLGGMGITRVGDCLRLPREGFARRFGAARLLQLDRALGRLPDPRVSHRFAERFCARQDLEAEQHDSALLLPVCRQLLLQLERFLLTRPRQVQRVRFSFFHLRAAATHRVLGRVHAGRSAAHWFELLDLKLERLTLPAPVISIRLQGEPSRPLSAATDNLLFDQTTKSRDGSIACLVERLNARMGDACVRGVSAVAEHRPQYAWRSARLPDAAFRGMDMMGFWRDQPLPLRRPLWLLKNPERLLSEHARPFYQGPLTLLDGPERLESGWWDDDGIARDYFVAVTEKGRSLWVYKDRSKERTRWYLHGIFG